MSELITQLNMTCPDDIYEQLIELHAGLTEEQSMRVNAKLILLLLNHIGDEDVVRAAITAARGVVS